MLDQVKSQQTKRGSGMFIKNNIMFMFLMCMILLGNVLVSCTHTEFISDPGDPNSTKLNPPKLVELTVKDFSDDLGLDDDQLGRWRLVDANNRTLIIATEGDKISWTAGESDLQFQFPEKLSRRIFRRVEHKSSNLTDTFSFILKAGETLTVEVRNPHPEGTRTIFELTYAVLHVDSGELVATDSPPKIIFMF